MQPSTRLSSKERRQAIVEAVRGVFAENGFDGTTTRALAKAAGVSEALLYKHFPSKESLYAAMLDACAEGPAFAEFNRILASESSTATLVNMVHFAISYYVKQRPGDPHREAMNCLSVRSLLEDGKFVRLTHKKFASAWTSKFEACLKAAARAGDLRAVPVRRDLRVWFVQHIAFSLMLHLRPRIPAVDYKASRDALVEQATWFALLGAGVREEAIKRYCNAKARSRLAG
ncbi:MAG: TetR/AcrR family transcriptional regulator [Candidatus Binatia bacterium]